MQLKPLCYISILFPCLCFVVNAMCTLKKCLCLDLFVIVVKLCTCSTCHGTLFHWTSTYINTKIKLMLVQNYGWPTGPAKVWLWLARRPFGWPRATGPAGSTTPALPEHFSSSPKKFSTPLKISQPLLKPY